MFIKAVPIKNPSFIVWFLSILNIYKNNGINDETMLVIGIRYMHNSFLILKTAIMYPRQAAQRINPKPPIK
jgi:hypothetical protein